jgi:hypothetical protein
VAFSVSGRLLFAGYDDFECKVGSLNNQMSCIFFLLIYVIIGLGCATR